MPNDTDWYTAIPFLYRDDDNYKEHSYLLADGKITREQRDAMQEVLVLHDQFVPGQLGIAHLGEVMPSFPSDSDNAWHEVDLDAVETGTGEVPFDGVHVGDITAFVNLFVAEGRKGWNDAEPLLG